MIKDLEQTAQVGPRKAISYIRFSTPRQARGHSRKRQTDGAEEYCTKHGLSLTDDCRLLDAGKSAFHGANLTDEAALGGFLKKVNRGEIERGTVLIIENLDRLSRREEILEVISEVLKPILKAGIELVILSDKQAWTYERANKEATLFLLSVALAIGRGHDESKIKSIRSKANWQKKTAAIKRGEPVRYNAPCWLKFNSESKSFEPIPERADIVKRMFELCLKGKGAGEITYILNREKVPLITVGRSKATAYNQRFVLNVLHNKAVIGHNTSVEPPVPNYFKPVVDETTFHAANLKIQERKHFRGIKRADTNPFSRLCFCSKCGKTMYRHNQTHRNKIDKYHELICTGARQGTCSYKAMNFERFEYTFAQFLTEVEMIYKPNGTRTQEPSKTDEIKGKIVDVDKQRNTLKVALLKQPDQSKATTVVTMLTDLDIQHAQLTIELEQETTRERGTPILTNGHLVSLKGFFTYDKPKTPELLKEIREALRTTIERITVDTDNQRYTIAWKQSPEVYEVQLRNDGYEWKGMGGIKLRELL